MEDKAIGSDERTMAALAHGAGIFFPYLGPIVVFFIGRKSGFVRAHAVRALLEVFLWNVLLVIGAIISISIRISQLVQQGIENFDWLGMLVSMAITWILLTVIGFCFTIASVFQAIAAYRGKWGDRGVLGRLSLKITKSGPALGSSTELTRTA